MPLKKFSGVLTPNNEKGATNALYQNLDSSSVSDSMVDRVREYIKKMIDNCEIEYLVDFFSRNL